MTREDKEQQGDKVDVGDGGVDDGDVDVDEGQDDIVWNEHQIWDDKKSKANNNNNKNNDDDDDDDELDNELTQQMFHFFDTKSEPEFEIYKFQISSKSSCAAAAAANTTSSCASPEDGDDVDEEEGRPNNKFLVDLAVRGEPETNNSTGMGLWRGAEVLAQYMCDVHTWASTTSAAADDNDDDDDDDSSTNLCRPYPDFQWKNQRVLEVGAGLGLTGLTAYQLGASSVLLTDGDKDVLQNLRYNVKQNLKKTDTTSSASTTTTTTTSISCPQLIWGQRLEEFRSKYGYQSVILAADCVYMAPSVEPLWQTIDALLDPLTPSSSSRDSRHADDDDDGENMISNTNIEPGGDIAVTVTGPGRPHGVVMYVNVSASTASPQSVLKAAAKYGFTWTSPVNEVMLFRRRYPGEEPPEISL